MKLFCPVCTVEKDVEYIGAYKNKNNIFKNKKLFQCQYCKIIFIQPMPTNEELEFYYKNIWLIDETISSTSKGAQLTWKIQADERLKYLSHHIDLHENMKVLDIGSGFGYLYDAFKENGYTKISFYATESNPDNLQRLKIKGIKTFPDLVEIKERDFDLITVCFVLEHINAPFKFLYSLKEYVKEGGYIFIDVPERDDTFKPILEPHVAVYTIESLNNLVNKIGLDVVHMTGYGRKRSELITKQKENKAFLNIIRTIFSKTLNKISELVSKENKIKNLYRCYKFNEEGIDRWWIRAILRKPVMIKDTPPLKKDN